MKSILNIVINYANENEVIAYAQMLEKQSWAEKVSLVVVINKKSENPITNLIEELNKINLLIKVYDPKENLGYMNGALYGYRQFIHDNNEIPDWTIISNTDLAFTDDLFFEKFFSYKYEQDVWCIAPSIFNSNNKTYNNPMYTNRIPLGKINRLIFVFEHPLLSLIYITVGKCKAKAKKRLKKNSKFCYAVHGCFFALKNEFIQLIKDDDYQAFLYSEENYISELIRYYNKSCYYNSNVEIIHDENSSTGLLNYKQRAHYSASSLKYIRNEFYINDKKVRE